MTLSEILAALEPGEQVSFIASSEAIHVLAYGKLTIADAGAIVLHNSAIDRVLIRDAGIDVLSFTVADALRSVRGGPTSSASPASADHENPAR